MFHENTCTLKYCREHVGELEILKTIAQPGDVLYTVDKCGTWGGDIQPEWFDGLDFDRHPNPFERMLSAQKMG